MQITTVLLIILAAVAAMIIVLFQYFHKVKNKGKLRLVLSFLRFLTLFSIFLLLVNPKFVKKEFSLEKANLILLVDNSSSIAKSESESSLEATLNILKSSTELQNKFNIVQYRFGRTLEHSDSLFFSDKSTDITKALKSLNTIYGKGDGAIVLMSDGNATIGEDYGYYGKNQKFAMYPLVLGDTTSYEDLAIGQVNANKYAFLENKFPIEIFVTYRGKNDVNSRLNVLMDGKNVFSRDVTLSNENNSMVVSTLLDASSVGLKNISISLVPLPRERNTFNNTKNISIEVIDEKTNIAIISGVLHPDIGTLKKAFERNEQRSVSILRPSIDSKSLEDVDLFILYQPNSSFKNIYDHIAKTNTNTFTITGPMTDWDFLNDIQISFTKDSYEQSEEATPIINKGFSFFDISNFQVGNYPPLETNLGEVIINKSHQILLGQRIKGTEIDEPLLVLAGNDLNRDAILFGENIWKWRVQSYREHKNFEAFDEILGKIAFYLSTKKSRSRLMVDYDSFYEGNNDVRISATYFDETFTFDPDASLSLVVKEKGANSAKEFPMLLKGGYYEADLSNLPPGEYDFTVKESSDNLSKSGGFTIQDFDVEQQFVSSNYKKMGRLANDTNGGLYFPSEAQELVQDLITEDKFKPIRKSSENVVSLVDFRFLLAVIIIALSAEWFIRKYNGLI